MRQLWIGLPCVMLLACGDDASSGTPDAPNNPPDMGMPDAQDLHEVDEGGESRLEYQEILTPGGPILQARSTQYFFKSKNPAIFPFVTIPGCNMVEDDTHFPFAMGDTREALDVGDTIITGGAQQFFNASGSGPVPGSDGLSRPHAEHWNFRFEKNPVGTEPNGLTFAGNFDAPYNLIFTGSDEWPPQVYEGAHYMPSNWELTDETPGTPATPGTSPGFEPVALVADTPLTIKYTTDPFVNHPEGTTLNMIVALLVAPFGPVVECVEEGLDGELTVPAEFVNHARMLQLSSGTPNGLMARAHVSHILHELDDGKGTIGHKRFDAFTIWCYVTPWTPAP